MPIDEVTELDLTDPDERKQHEAKRRNAVAVASLTMAFTTQALMKHVNKACDEDWPGGLAHKIVKSLFAKYRPKDNITKVELRMMLNKVSMKSTDEPDKLFEQLGEIQNYDTNGNVDEADLMAVVFTVAPAKYQSVLSSLQLEKKDKLTLEDLEEAMDQVWRQNSAIKGNSNNDSNKDELNLATQDNGETKKSRRFKGKCNRCGKEGHMARNCWTDPKNADKCPNGYKVPEIAAASTGKSSKELQLSNIAYEPTTKDKSSVVCSKTCSIIRKRHVAHECWKSKAEPNDELQLANVTWGKYAEAFAEDDYESEDDFAVIHEETCEPKELQTETMLRSLPPKAKGLEVLEDPEIFIIDTGATQHSTGHGAGLTNPFAHNSATRVGNGQIVKAKAVGKMPFVTVDGTKGTMGEVHLIPGSPFNLISGTKLQDLGFEVHGKGNAIEYTKDGMSLKFDIRINTPKGMVLTT